MNIFRIVHVANFVLHKPTQINIIERLKLIGKQEMVGCAHLVAFICVYLLMLVAQVVLMLISM